MPIPSNETPTLEEVRFQGQTLGTISRELSPTSNLRSGSGVHLDPDLNREALPRQQGWLPCFGQVGSAQSHLKNQKVREGDLFLFFGWFRKVIQVDGRYCYDPAADDIQALFGWLFGWLQVGAIYRPGVDGHEPPIWASDHPHVKNELRRKVSNNTLYVASSSLQLPGLEHLPGGGAFRQFSAGLQLTAEGKQRSIWRLPHCFYPNGASALTYHKDLGRWAKDKHSILLRTVGRGQEFVLDCEHHAGVDRWLEDIFRLAFPMQEGSV